MLPGSSSLPHHLPMAAPGMALPPSGVPGVPPGMALPSVLPGAPAGSPPPPPAGGIPGADPSGQMQAMLMYQQMIQQQMGQQQLQMQHQAAATSQLTLQAAQAYEESVQHTIDTDVQEMARHFKLDERITKDLDVQMKRRKQSFEEDLKALWEILEGARNPAGLLRVKIREMEEGTFRGTATPDRDVEDLARKFNLDAQASAKLAEVLSKREDRKKDLRQIQKHLELSNKPSSLVMLMLKDLRAGITVKDPEYPAAVGSYAHKRGLKRGARSRSRGDKRRRHESSDSSSSPPRPGGKTTVTRSSGAGPALSAPPRDGVARPMTLLERFG